ncbi:UPF0182 family protein [Microbacterium sp.]|uniref:UPF0182 family membrane protein n=1 Tax=Microbacterium sp. TaxID=51671 RepID=UPI003A8DFBF9
MTSSSYRPPATRSASRRILGVSVAIIVALIVAFFIFASLYTEFLWFDQLKLSNVLTTQWIATVTMFVAGFLAMALPIFLCIQLAYRLRPVYVKLSSQLDRYQEVIEPLRRLAMWGMPVFFGIFAGFAAAGNWKTVWLWANGVSTKTLDPQFHLDTGFYLFAMPFYSMLLAFISAVLLLCLLITALVSYLYGSVRIGQRELRISKPARIQLAILAGIYLAVQAVSLWLDRYLTLVQPEGRIIGAGYTGVNATIPGQGILAIIAAVVAVLFLITAVIGRWRFPLAATALFVVASLVVGMGYPWVVTTFQVKPNENNYQAQYYERNIAATKAAFGVDKMKVTPFKATTDTAAGQLRADADTTASVRIMDPAVIPPTVRQLEQYRSYYQFSPEMDVDRYTIDGKSQDTVVSVRDLDMSKLGAGDTWNNRVAVYTHGYGLVAMAGNERTSDGNPVFLEQGIPTSGVLTDTEHFEPRVYFGETSPEYSIVGAPKGTKPVEIDYPRGQDDKDKDTTTTFTGNGGPRIGNTFTKLLYALKFQSEQILFSNLVNSDSQILYDREPITRVQKVAPYLTLDHDPYPSVVDGRIVWIVDGYTTSSTYPYSQTVNMQNAIADSTTPASAVAFDNVNYIRNSVKATVDAYDGSVKLYAWDDQDPILQAWEKIYPSTIRPISEMSGDLMSHVRYPTDLFKVQRNILGTYHIDDAGSFAQEDNRWQTPPDPQNKDALQPPYYLSMKMPGQDSPRFSMFSTYIPADGQGESRQVLMGYLAVDSDAGSKKGVKSKDYGTLRMLELNTSTPVPGPGQVQNIFDSNASVAEKLNVLTIGKSQVLYGNLLTLPVGGGLLYVQPVFVQSSEGAKLPTLRKVLVAFGDQVAFEDTLTEALDALFGGDSGAAGGDQGVTPTPGDGTTPPDQGGTTTPPVASDAVAQALSDAKDALNARETALKAGDLEEFAVQDKKLTAAIEKLLTLEDQTSSSK